MSGPADAVGLASAAVLLLAGGAGTRLGGGQPKQLQMLDGKPLVQRAAETYRHAGLLVVVHHPDFEREIGDAVDATAPSGRVVTVPGGATRRASIRNGMRALAGLADDVLVVLHNAASPNTPTALVERCLEAAAATGAAQAYLPSHHTVVRVRDGTVDEVLDRRRLGYTADPTVYRLGLLRSCLEGTDEGAGEMTLDLVRRRGVTVTAVPSPVDNVKVTVPHELGALEPGRGN